MGLRNISAWSIRNPIIPLVMFVGLLFAGFLSFSRMSVQNDPDIEFPVVVVSISQPGAAPSELYTQVTEKVESAVASVQGVDVVASTASEGNSNTRIQMDIGENIDVAVNEVKAAVDQIRGDLPDGILEPRVFKVATSSNDIVNFAVTADDMTMEQLSWFTDDVVTKRLLAVPGVAAASRRGGVNREIRVTLDPARMQSLGVTAVQINAALRQNNVNSGGGQSEIAGSRQSVRVLGNAETAFDLSQRQIPLGAGRSVKLADVATVTDGASEITAIAKVGGRPVVTFGIQRARGKSDVSVYDDSIKALDEIKKTHPGVHFTELFNSVTYTKGQYESSISSMVEGAILAVVVVFFFLRDWRATIISAIAIPLSAIPTFWFMSMLGFTLNSMSLLALGLVAGVLVDDAIVEIENIVRHMRMGKTAYQASIDAADEIGIAVVATTFSIAAVFLPVGLMPGVAGQFFKNFGLTVVAAVLMSLAVARMITPMIAAYFLREHGEEEHANGKWMQRYTRVLEWSIDRRKAEAYRARTLAARGHLSFPRRIKARFLDHRIWILGIGLGAFLLTIVMFAITPMQFFPTTNLDFSMVKVEMVPGTTLEQTEKVIDQTVAILKRQQEVKDVLENVGEGSGSLYVTLRDDRVRNSQEMERQVAIEFQKIADARVTFQQMQQGPPGGSGRAISVMLAGSDPKLLDQAALKLVDQMKTVSAIRSPRVEADLQRPELIVTPRTDLAASLGVSTASLSQAIRVATIGEIDMSAAKFSLADRQVPIRVVLPTQARSHLGNIENLPVPTTSGGSVPLSRVADIRFGQGPISIQSYDRQRRVYIGADLAPGAQKGVADQEIEALPLMKNLPSGVEHKKAGSEKFLQELLVNFAIALVTGILLVFAVLVLLYRRLMSPLVNMGSLLLAPLGGLIALRLLGQPISMPVFIGILMLFGIVAKNSILLVDFAIEEMARGKTRFEAIIEAGQKRAQPIVMTTVAMTAGMIPTALSLSGDGAWRAPMGTVVIGGLLLSTALTLLIVPSGFSLAAGVERRLGPKLRRTFLSYDPQRDGPQHDGHQAGGHSNAPDGGGPARRVRPDRATPLVRARVARAELLPDRARTMRRTATGLLVAMAGLFVLSLHYLPAHPAWGFVHAFAEAAMVGGLADWFAVTALFRRPLGLPIPHTAIIPENKDRIADTMAMFLRENFLTPAVVARRMSDMNLAQAVGSYLAAPARGSGSRVRAGGGELLVSVLQSLDPERLGTQVRSALAAGLERLPLAPLAGKLLAAMIADGRHRAVIDSMIRWAGLVLEDNEQMVRDMIHARANGLLRFTGLDERLANSVLDGLYKLLAEVLVDPEHPLRGKVEEGLAKLARDLVEDEETREKVERMKRDLIANPAVAEWWSGVWERLRRGLIAMIRGEGKPDASFTALAESMTEMGAALRDDPRLQWQVNRFARRTAVGVASRYGGQIVQLVSETVKRWDAQTVAARIEGAVGRDLQFIRMNGTLVGGLVGLVLYAASIFAR